MQKQQGFTLVELAVSLVVIGLVLGMVSLPLMRQLIQSGLVALESRLAVLTLAIVPVQTINVASASRRGREKDIFTVPSPSIRSASVWQRRRQRCRKPPTYRQTPPRGISQDPATRHA